MRLLPNLRSNEAAQAGDLRLSAGRWPVVSYLLNRGQLLCTLLCTLSYLSAEGLGYSRWVRFLGNKYVAAELLEHLADYTMSFGCGGMVLGFLSALLFVRGSVRKFALALLSLVLCILIPVYGVA